MKKESKKIQAVKQIQYAKMLILNCRLNKNSSIQEDYDKIFDALKNATRILLNKEVQ